MPTLKDLTLAKVKAAYKKRGLTPKRGYKEGNKCCALDALGFLADYSDNEPLELGAFMDGFDEIVHSRAGWWAPYQHPFYYRRGKQIAKALLGK